METVQAVLTQFGLSARWQDWQSAAVRLTDYDHLQAHLDLGSQAGVGPADTETDLTLQHHGEHYKTLEDGQRLAQVRLQARQCRAQTLHAEGPLIVLIAGTVIQLRDPSFEGYWLVTRMTVDTHAPLKPETEIWLTHANGNPDRPRILGAIYNGGHGDAVTAKDASRNVIRTLAGNKLRLEDEQGQEHIKLHTPQGNSQLNLGHAVDHTNRPRGQGVELRSEFFGAVRSGQPPLRWRGREHPRQRGSPGNAGQPAKLHRQPVHRGQPGRRQPKVRADKQRSFATLLDAVDYGVGYWKGFAKSEPSYDFLGGQALMMAPPQRPRRKGRCYWRKEPGSISPDIVVVRRRNLAPERDNVTHIVDMKFGEDGLGKRQGERYTSVLGPKLLALYFPTHCTVSDPGERDPAPEMDWVKVLLAILMLLATGGKGGGLKPAF